MQASIYLQPRVYKAYQHTDIKRIVSKQNDMILPIVMKIKQSYIQTTRVEGGPGLQYF